MFIDLQFPNAFVLQKKRSFRYHVEFRRPRAIVVSMKKKCRFLKLFSIVLLSRPAALLACRLSPLPAHSLFDGLRFVFTHVGKWAQR